MRLKNLTIIILAIILSLLVSSCGPGQALGPTMTPSQTATNTPIPTSTYTPTPTATATIVPNGTLVVWDKMELNIGGRLMEFAMGAEEGADITNMWGITKMEINDNLADAEKKLSSLIGASFWQIYAAQSGEKITYEDYLSTPDKYKINLVTPDGEGGYKSTLFSFDQIKKFERRFVGNNDGRLFFDVVTATYLAPELKGIDQYCGYEFTEDGRFVVYETLDVSGPMLTTILSDEYPLSSDDSTEYFVGNIVGSNIIDELFGVAFSPDQKTTEEIKDHQYVFLVEFYPSISETSSSPNFDEMVKITGGSSDKNAADYFTNYGYWKVDLPNLE